MLDVIRNKVVRIFFTYRRSIQYKHINNNIILHKKPAKYKVKKHFYMHITACKLTVVEYKTECAFLVVFRVLFLGNWMDIQLGNGIIY